MRLADASLAADGRRDEWPEAARPDMTETPAGPSDQSRNLVKFRARADRRDGGCAEHHAKADAAGERCATDRTRVAGDADI